MGESELKPTLLDLALREWKILRNRLLDTYTAVFLEGDYSAVFVGFIRSRNNLDLEEFLPADPDSINSVLRESDCLLEIIKELQDNTSDLMDFLRLG